MNVSVATSVWVALLVCLSCWAFLKFRSIPSCYDHLAEIKSDEIKTKAAHLGGLQMFEGLFFGATIALGALTIIAVVLDLYAGSLDNSEGGLASLVSVRDIIEVCFGWARAFGFWVWLGVLVTLSIIYWVILQTRSQTRWENALDARSDAIAAALGGSDSRELRALAQSEIPDDLAVLDEQVSALKVANSERVEGVLHRPMLTIGEGGEEISIAELRHTAVDFRMQAKVLREQADAGADAERLEVRG